MVVVVQEEEKEEVRVREGGEGFEWIKDPYPELRSRLNLPCLHLCPHQL
jgi:hypothetical protein